MFKYKIEMITISIYIINYFYQNYDPIFQLMIASNLKF